jgi:hypothetical protein
MFVCLYYSECWCGVAEGRLLKCSPVIGTWHNVAGSHIPPYSGHSNLLVVMQEKDVVSKEI